VRFIITLFQDEDGIFVAECPAIPGCVSQGKTESEAGHFISLFGDFGLAGKARIAKVRIETDSHCVLNRTNGNKVAVLNRP